jgi:hypothetical protein
MVDSCREAIDKLSEWEITIHQGWLDLETASRMREATKAKLDTHADNFHHRKFADLVLNTAPFEQRESMVREPTFR